MERNQRSNIAPEPCASLGSDLLDVPLRPRLAVLIPVFNAQDALERSLASLSDSFEEFDVFLVDDGSDPPIEVPPNLPFSTTLLRLPQNGGITKALNAGLRQILPAGYEYVGRLDAGDLTLPGRFEAQLAFLDTHPDHAVVGCHADYVDPHGQRLFIYRPPADHRDLSRFMKRRNGMVHQGTVIRSECFGVCGLYDEAFCGAEDYELCLRFSTMYKIANLPQVFVVVDVNPTSVTARRFRSAVRLRVQARYFDFLSPHCYLGVLRSVLALFTSRRLVILIKQRGDRLRMFKARNKPVRGNAQ